MFELYPGPRGWKLPYLATSTSNGKETLPSRRARLESSVGSAVIKPVLVYIGLVCFQKIKKDSIVILLHAFYF